jgi:hypothetical protein
MFYVRVKRTKGNTVLKSLAKASEGPDNVQVGFPAGKVSSDIIKIAVWNHFGTKGGGWGGPIPERPFLTNAMRANARKYADFMKVGAKSIVDAALSGTSTSAAKRQTLQKLGVSAQGDIQSEITSLRSPPNSPVTIARKGSSNPLIDSGQLRQSVTYKVEDE